MPALPGDLCQLTRMWKFYGQLFAGLPREVWLLSLVTFVQRSGTMVLPFLTLYLTQRQGFTVQGAGGILSLYGIGAIVGSYVGGWCSDRIGAVRTQIVSLCLATGALVTLSQMRSPLSIIVVVLLWSIAAESMRPANGAALAEMSPPHLHARVFGLRRLSMNLGMSIGPAVGGFVVTWSYNVLFMIEASMALLAAGLLWGLLPSGGQHARSTPPDQTLSPEPASLPQSPWRDGVFLAIVGLTTLLVTTLCQLFGAYPLTLTEVHHFPAYAIGLVFTVNTLVIVVCQMPILHVVARFDTLRVIGVGAFFLCGGFALLPLGTTTGALIATVLVWTFGEMLTTPLLESFVATRSPVENRGQYMGLFSSAFSVAFVLAPLGGTWIYGRYGYLTLWGLCGLLGVGLWLAFFVLSTTVRGYDAGLTEGKVT
ncbi:MAG: MFS transporter [Deltaproteobacteria bacterium]|nr:MFS transporter [Deltaproteobacteria bacterium]